MPIIKPASELRNNYVAMTALAKETRQPIYLTKNGTGDMVLMTMEEYDKREALLNIYESLSEGEVALKAGKTVSLDQASKAMLDTIKAYKAE
ncbi:MAG: type II toxin-antitoxin system Phd/YefM family antitoxin [Clostridiales bacterium]|jgi:prevent-host-death family protein|nr:type II toxin-antitoxin system Phd/YefM family antitoxin [Clostridiales bacterium]